MAEISQQQLEAMASTARSPVEVANEQTATQQNQQAQPDQGDAPPDFEKALQEARAKDSRQTQAPREEPERQQQQQQSKETTTEEKSGIEWKPKDNRKAKQWDALKENYTKREQELLQQIEQLKTTSPQQAQDILNHPEFKKIKEAHDKYYDIVKQVAVEHDPEFQAKYQPKKTAVINAAKFAAGGAADKIEKLLQQPSTPYRDQQLEELTADFSEGSKRKINAALATLEQIEMEQEAEKSQRKATWESRQSEAFQKHNMEARQREESIKDAFGKVLSKWQNPDNGMPFVVPSGENAAKAAEVVQRAERILFNQDPNYGYEDLANDAMRAAVLPDVLQYLNAVIEQNSKLEDAYNRLRGVDPDAGMQSGYSDNTAKVDPTAPEYFHHFAGGLEAARQRDASTYR